MAFKNYNELKHFVKHSRSNNTFASNDVQKQIAEYFEGKELKLFTKDHNKKWIIADNDSIDEMANDIYRYDFGYDMIGLEKGIWCFSSSMVDKLFTISGLTYTCSNVGLFTKSINLRREITDAEIKQFNNKLTNRLQQYLKEIFGQFKGTTRYDMYNVRCFCWLEFDVPYVDIETNKSIAGNSLWYYWFNSCRITVCESKTKELYFGEYSYSKEKLQVDGSFSIPYKLLKPNNIFQSGNDMTFELTTKGAKLRNILNPECDLTHTLIANGNLTVLINEA